MCIFTVHISHFTFYLKPYTSNLTPFFRWAGQVGNPPRRRAARHQDLHDIRNGLPQEVQRTEGISMKGKTCEESALKVARFMEPQDANFAGNVHGGVIMKHIDSLAGMIAFRHARGNVVTASVDRLDFHGPVFIGNLLRLMGCVNMVGRTSMEVGVRVEAENVLTDEVRHIASAYLTLVALDEHGRPKEVPPLMVDGEDKERRHAEALARRKIRLEEKRREKA
jgi:acyl-CoA hydrolase